jgi:hypothetical protein
VYALESIAAERAGFAVGTEEKRKAGVVSGFHVCGFPVFKSAVTARLCCSC